MSPVLRPLLPSAHVLVIFLGSVLLCSEPIAASQKALLRGVAPEDLPFYSGQSITCRDGSKTIPIGRVNDDFCDCADGTDEPGTAACADGMFYCRNKGHVPLVVFASRVNDGICDCCDGSDEYTSPGTCQNTCKEEGAASRQDLTQEVAKYTEGAKKRQRLVDEAEAQREAWDAEAKKLEAEQEELKIREAKLLEAKTAIEKAEQEVREREEKVRKEQEAQEQALREAAAGEQADEPTGAAAEGAEEASEDQGQAQPDQPGSDDPPADIPESEVSSVDEPGLEEPPSQDSGSGNTLEEYLREEEVPPVNEELTEEPSQVASAGEPEVGSDSGAPSEGDNFEGLSKEEIGRRIASRWTGGGESTPPPPTEPEPPVDEDEIVYAKEVHEPFHRPEDDDEPEYMEDDYHEKESILDEEEPDDEPEAEPGPEDHDEDMDHFEDDGSTTEGDSTAPETEAERVKMEYQKVVKERQNRDAQISALRTKLQNDYGPDSQFVSFAGQCFKMTVNQYVYEVCPYKKAIQEEGHINTLLGNWGGFRDNYSKMTFTSGDRCWNGPARSLTVTLECGLTNKLFAVSEPSRCEYAAIMTTPAVCSAEKAAALQRQLEEKLQELTERHDEL